MVATGWTVIWGIAMLGVYDQTYGCDANNQNCNPNYGLLFLCFLSYFFGHQVIQVCAFNTFYYRLWLPPA